MKAPKYAALGVQAMIDAGINGFAMQLMAESHADDPAKFGDETVVLMAKAHNGTPVYMILSTQRPDAANFKDWPVSDGKAPAKEGSAEPEGRANSTIPREET